MARPKKVPPEEKVSEIVLDFTRGKMFIAPVSVDFNSEGLNNLAMKVNEIITHLNK